MSHPDPKQQVLLDQADYVVSVAKHKDGSSAIATVARELKAAGFSVAAMPSEPKGKEKGAPQGTSEKVTSSAPPGVVFLVHLTPRALAKAAADLQSRDVAAGVPTPAISLDGEDLTPALRDRFAYETLQRNGLTPDRNKAISAVWPYGHQQVNESLFKKSLGVLSLDVNFVRVHYGDQVALYFAFAGYAAKAMAVPAGLGVLGRVLGPRISGLLLVVWSIVFNFLWRFQETEYAKAWSTYNVQDVTTRRQAFNGTSSRSRQIRSVLFVPLAAFLCFLYLLAVVAGLAFEVFMTQLYDGPFKSVLALAPTGGYVVLAQLFRLVYDKFLEFYLSFEDFEYQETEDYYRTQRKFWATFFLNYTPILLSAYLYLPFGHYIAYGLGNIRSSVAGYNLRIVPEFELNTLRLTKQTKYYSITNQLVLFATDAIVPFAMAWLAKRKIPQGDAAPVQLQAKQAPYDVDGDFLVITSLIGYALLLAPVWPLAPVAVAVGIVLRTKASAFKLAYDFRRPNVKRVNSIGTWNSNLLFLSGLAAVTIPTITVMYENERQWTQDQSLVAVTPFAVLALAFVCENLFLVSAKAVESSFNALVLPPTNKLPPVQTAEAPMPTASDLAWENHNLEQDLRSL